MALYLCSLQIDLMIILVPMKANKLIHESALQRFASCVQSSMIPSLFTQVMISSIFFTYSIAVIPSQ